MNAPTTDRPTVDAIPDGDWLRCGSCGTRGPVGMTAHRQGARYPCKACGTWNRVEVPEVRE